MNQTDERRVSESTASNVRKDINRNNYYDFLKHSELQPITTNWLRRNEALPIIVDELTRAGHKIKTGVPYQLADGRRLVLDAFIEELNAGVVFNTTHIASIKPEQRSISKFVQITYTGEGRIHRDEFTDLGPDIIVLQETWYWYQYYDDGSADGLLNKATAENILRQDVSYMISGIKR